MTGEMFSKADRSSDTSVRDLMLSVIDVNWPRIDGKIKPFIECKSIGQITRWENENKN